MNVSYHKEEETAPLLHVFDSIAVRRNELRGRQESEENNGFVTEFCRVFLESKPPTNPNKRDLAGTHLYTFRRGG